MRTTMSSAILAGAVSLLLVHPGVSHAGDIAKCEDGVAKSSRNVGKQEQKKNRMCVKEGFDDSTPASIRKLQGDLKRDKLVTCSRPAPNARGHGPVNGDPTTRGWTEEAAGNILRGVSRPVDGIVLDSNCHDKIAKRSGKKFDTELNAFRNCVRDNAPLTRSSRRVHPDRRDRPEGADLVQPKLEADVPPNATSRGSTRRPDDGAVPAAPTDDLRNCIGDSSIARPAWR